MKSRLTKVQPSQRKLRPSLTLKGGVPLTALAAIFWKLASSLLPAATPSQILDGTRLETLEPYSNTLRSIAPRRLRPPMLNFMEGPLLEKLWGIAPLHTPMLPKAPVLSEVVRLEAGFSVSQIGPYFYKHRGYNGGLVGPAIRVRPGDVLRIRLVNNLPLEGASAGHNPDEPHDFNETNLHTHGLHASPSGEADNVLIAVKPGETFDFTIPIPYDQPPGTFWYHPHKHGSVALQVASGMAGPLIVEGGLDNAPELADVGEQTLVFQQFILPEVTQSGGTAEITPEDVYKGSRPVARATLINGQLLPVLYLRPGEIQRWRLIHAGLEATLDLHLTDHEFHEFALDGLNTGALTKRTRVELQPGQRSDVLVQASRQAGVFYLTTEVANAARAVRGRTVPKTFVAKVIVEGDPVVMTLPTPEVFQRYVPPLLRPIADAELTGPARQVEMNIQDYTINGQRFGADRIDVRAQLDTAEEWTISSYLDRHPFHLHVNPFQVWTRDRDTGSEGWVWRDTAFLGDGEKTRIRVRYLKFGGLTVMHCHNLDHEDRGMMSLVLINDPKDPWPESLKPTTAAVVGRPAWRGQDTAGHLVTSEQMAGKPVLLVLHRGLSCMHCASQLGALSERAPEFARLGVRLVAVGPTANEQVMASFQRRYGTALLLLTDNTRQTFQNFGCLSTELLHGVFALNSIGEVTWQTVGSTPEMDIAKILTAITRTLSPAASADPLPSRSTKPSNP